MTPPCARSLVLLIALSGAAPAAGPKDVLPEIDGLVTVELDSPATPPAWALRERHLLENLYPALLEFVGAYTRPDGSLIWRDEWPGMDGSDDGYESFYNFGLYYALGGPAAVDGLSRKLWEAVTAQFTRYGQVHEEFDGYYDWMHHGESYVSFYFLGLADPTPPKWRERALRFAGLYLGEDPSAPNWDPERLLIRSPINGSRGPRFETTAEDWSTHRPVLAEYPLPYDDVPGVSSSAAWVDDEEFPHLLAALNRRMMRCDVPLNLTTTSLVANAYLHTGAEKYRRWIVDYVRAWEQRARDNGGVLPDNVGPTGRIGETMDGKWWGGYYGWRWPHGLFNLMESTTIAAANALLVTGDRSFLELPRGLIDAVTREARREGGRVLVPHRRGDRGWYDYRALDPQCPILVWYLSRDDEDRRRIERVADVSKWNDLPYRKHKGDSGNEPGWVRFLEGANPGYPERILEATWAETLRRLEMTRRDTSDPAERNVHHWQQRNPVVLEGLVQLMLGAPNHVYHGGLLHCQVRYFDPAGRRPGVPADVAALVERIEDRGITLTLVNVHPSEPRDVIVQAGAYGEHRFTTVRHGSAATPANRPFVHVRLGPGTVATVDLGIERFVNKPTYAFPWHGQ